MSVNCLLQNSNHFFVHPVFQPPVITGSTTVAVGGTLSLDCDASNSAPTPSVVWLDPQRMVVTNSRDLVIDNIQRSAAGTYMCVATVADDSHTSSVDVDV